MNYKKIDEKERDLLADDVAGILVEGGQPGKKINQKRGMIKHSLGLLEDAGIQLFVGVPGKLATDGGEYLDALDAKERGYYVTRVLEARGIVDEAGYKIDTAAWNPELMAAVFDKIATPLHYKRQEAAKLKARDDYKERAKKAQEELKDAGKDRV